MNQFDLSIVIPAYCEEKRIGNTLNALAEYMRNETFFKSKKVEVIVVAADAPDKTYEIASSKQSQFPSRQFRVLTPGPRVGKGRDVKYGMSHAKGRIIMYMDADLATPLYHIPEFYDACSHGVDLVIGTRNLLKYRNSLARNIFSRIGNILYTATGGVRIEDTQCGFKMFSDHAAQICFSRLTLLGWGFDLEVLAIAQADRLNICSIRIDDWEDKPFSTYSDGMLKILLRTFRDYIYINAKRIRGAYT